MVAEIVEQTEGSYNDASGAVVIIVGNGGIALELVNTVRLSY